MSRSGSDVSGGKGGNTRPPSSKRWCFTLNNYTKILKNGLDGFASQLDKLCKLYVFQEETGECGTPHLQGCCWFNKACRPSEALQYKQIHWEKCRDWDASIEYCSKEDTRSGQVFSNFEIESDEIEVETPTGWQLQILDIIGEKPDKRKIHWFWSERGRVGKSQMAKFLAVKHKALVIGGKASDMKMAVAAMDKKPKICVLDVPRSVEHVSYTGLEEIKNGCFFSSKYESGMVLMNPPHMIVFANFCPPGGKLSSDRLIVTRIDMDVDSEPEVDSD